MDASTIATTSTDKMKQIESIEYNISLFEELTFMQRNIIRYNFRKLIDENFGIKICHIENFIPIHTNNEVSHYKLIYLYKKRPSEPLMRTSIDTEIYINPYKIITTSFFFFSLRMKEKYETPNNIDEIHTEYFINYENYPPTEHLL